MTEYSPTDLATQLKSGLLSFPVTHFADNLSFDEAGYRKHLAWLAQYPVAGLFAAGGTGEGFSMTPEETDQVVRTAGHEVAGAVPVLAPATGSTVNAIAQARAAQAAGADGLLLMPPYLTETSQAGLVEHVSRVCGATGLGVVLDRDRLAEAHGLYLEHVPGARDDAMAMQYLVPDWSFDPKRPCLVR